MVKDENSLRKTVLKVIDYLKNKIELETIILFGSYANGAPHVLSDVDLAIISPDFESQTLEERAKLFSEVKLNCDLDVEIHLFSSQDLAEARPTNFLGYIVKNGKFYLKNKKLVA